MNFLKEAWLQARPYIIAILADGAVAMVFWSALWLFKKLTITLPIDGWIGEYIPNVHSLGAVLAFTLFIIMFIIDVIEIKKDDTRKTRY